MPTQHTSAARRRRTENQPALRRLTANFGETCPALRRTAPAKHFSSVWGPLLPLSPSPYRIPSTSTFLYPRHYAASHAGKGRRLVVSKFVLVFSLTIDFFKILGVLAAASDIVPGGRRKGSNTTASFINVHFIILFQGTFYHSGPSSSQAGQFSAHKTFLSTSKLTCGTV